MLDFVTLNLNPVLGIWVLSKVRLTVLNHVKVVPVWLLSGKPEENCLLDAEAFVYRLAWE
jgi:hypothetical protein